MDKKPVYVFAKWNVKPGRLDAVLGLMAEVAGKSREEKGNLFYKIHQNSADPNMLILFEGYVDDAAVDEHRNSAYFRELVLGQIVPELESREVILASEILFEIV